MPTIRLGLLCLLSAACVSNRQLATHALGRLETPVVDYDSYQAEAVDADAAALRATFEAEVTPEMKQRLHHDPRMDLVAVAVFEHFVANQKAPQHALQQWVMWRAGVPYREIHARVWNAGGKPNFRKWDAQLQLEAKALEIPFAKQPPGPVSYGIARGQSGAGAFGQAVVFATRLVELQRVAKTVAPGGALVIAGRVMVPATRLRIAYSGADDEDVRLEAPVDAGGSFSVELTAPTEPGRYFLAFSNPETQKVLGSVPIYVGVTEPAEPDGPRDGVAETKALRAKLAELHGGALTDDPVLEAAAQQTANAVCKGGEAPEDDAAITKALSGFASSKVKTITRTGAPYRLKKDPTSDAAEKVAIISCEIEAGGKEGQQYVLIVTAKPKP